MARTALLEPDDDPHGRPLLPSTPEREAVLADRMGRRLELRHVDGRLVARITPGSTRPARALALLRGQPPR
jgi:hypothetical protein